MSIWRSRHKNVVQDQSECLTNFPTKAYTKIDTTSKLQVIQALDNGQCGVDIAREYGVPPQTVAHIYNQKDTIIKKYTQKYNLLKQIWSLNLEEKLLNWFEQQYKLDIIISEDELRNKALEILKPLGEEFTCIDDWLVNFRTRHNISKYTPGDECNKKFKEEWKSFLKSLDCEDIYLGGVCALSYGLDFNSYLSGENTDNYVSLLFIVNTLGTDKREVVVVGKELLEQEIHVRSLPASYYYCINSQINYSVISSYLKKWDNELSSAGKHVVLILGIPDSIINDLHLVNIRIVSTTNLNYVNIVLEKIVECFKFHYRRLQIIRNLNYGRDNCTFLDYVHMIGNAWYTVPDKFVQNLSLPPEEGSLYFNNKDNDENVHSISQWCKAYNVSLNIEQYSRSADKYIICDKTLPCIYCGQLDESMQALDILSQRDCQSTSGVEAYQAMKRLVSYLQGEQAGGSIIKYAKYLENHMEYGALLQMHQIIASTNDTL